MATAGVVVTLVQDPTDNSRNLLRVDSGVVLRPLRSPGETITGSLTSATISTVDAGEKPTRSVSDPQILSTMKNEFNAMPTSLISPDDGHHCPAPSLPAIRVILRSAGSGSPTFLVTADPCEGVAVSRNGAPQVALEGNAFIDTAAQLLGLPVGS